AASAARPSRRPGLRVRSAVPGLAPRQGLIPSPFHAACLRLSTTRRGSFPGGRTPALSHRSHSMGWTFVRLTRDQLIRELTATEDTERSRNEVIDHTLVGNVLWTVVRVTAKQAGVLGLAPGESATLI